VNWIDKRIYDDAMRTIDSLTKDRDELKKLAGELLLLVKQESGNDHDRCPDEDCNVKPTIKRAEKILGEK
jgi:hypothetical protein